LETASPAKPPPPPAEPAAAKRRILFVDDDAEFLQMIDRVMRLWSKGGLDIVSAQSASSALALLQNQHFDLIVVDVCMPVVDGLQFLSILNRRCPGLQKVVLTGYASEAYRTACLSNGAELFLEKPRTSEGMESIFATLDELTRWKPEPGFRGVLRRVGLMDVIQMECLGKNSSLLAVTSPKASGSIYIKYGSIIHAESGALKGEDAFNLLLGQASGDFRLNPFADPPEQTITASWEALLMDAAQRSDESAGAEAASNAAAAALPETAAPAPHTKSPLSAPAAPRVRVEELLICSDAGDVLHAWQCPNTDLRINLLEFLSQKTRLLLNVLSLGDLDRVEFIGEEGRLAAKIGSEHGIILRTSLASAPPPVEGQAAALSKPARFRAGGRPPSAERRQQAEAWFHTRLNLAGLLAATLQFSDRSSLAHALGPQFSEEALEALRRSVTDTFQVLNLQRFNAARARWTHGQAVIDCALWPDGTCLALVLARQAVDIDPAGAQQCLAEFLAAGAAPESSPLE